MTDDFSGQMLIAVTMPGVGQHRLEMDVDNFYQKRDLFTTELAVVRTYLRPEISLFLRKFNFVIPI